MKKYILNICNIASVEYTEEQFEELENVNIVLEDGIKVQSKVIYVEAQNLKHEMIMLVPIENFEVIEE